MPGVGKANGNAILHLGQWKLVSMVFSEFTKHESKPDS